MNIYDGTSQKSISSIHFWWIVFPHLFWDNLQAEMQGEEVPAAAAESSLESQQMEHDLFFGQCVYKYITSRFIHIICIYIIYVIQS